MSTHTTDTYTELKRRLSRAEDLMDRARSDAELAACRELYTNARILLDDYLHRIGRAA